MNYYYYYVQVHKYGIVTKSVCVYVLLTYLVLYTPDRLTIQI